MNCSYTQTPVFKLMVKKHNITGLKYLCITRRKEWQEYPGSGVYWTAHLNKHGYNFSTKLLFESEDYGVFVEKCKYYSDLWNVAKNKEFANRVPEYGYSCGDGLGNTNWDLWRANRTEEQKKEQYRKSAEGFRAYCAKEGHPFQTKFFNKLSAEELENLNRQKSETMKKRLENPVEMQTRSNHLRQGSKKFLNETIYLKSACGKYITTALKTGRQVKLKALLERGWEVVDKRPSVWQIKRQRLQYIPLKIRADYMYDNKGNFVLDLTPSKIKSMVHNAPPAE